MARREISDLLKYLADSGTGKAKLEIIGPAFAKGGSESEITERLKSQGITRATFKKIDSFMKHGRPVEDDAPADLTIYATRDELHSVIRELEARITVLENARPPVDADESEPNYPVGDSPTEPDAEPDPLADLT